MLVAAPKFQKDLIVWKLIYPAQSRKDILEFQKDLIVWKRFSVSISILSSLSFQKDLIVWKQMLAGFAHKMEKRFRRT